MIPEIEALDSRPDVIRIPNQMDVPVTGRILKLIDTAAFQRLARIRQLGFVSSVYPGATHSRFEHSLGVYRNALLFAKRLGQFDTFKNAVDDLQLEALAVAALLHDIGHWPWCHAIEDLGLSSIPPHESVADVIIGDSEISDLIRSDWNCQPETITRLIFGDSSNRIECLLASILSGPIDIDKMDYLYRDSLHCGVPYGMNFDSARLINSLCLNRDENGIAISSKGKTAAEMMVFARYVMFSEVYWHHAVRSATAMIQRIFYRWMSVNSVRCTAGFLSHLDDRSFSDELCGVHRGGDGTALTASLFGSKRQLYKRLLDYNAHRNPEFFQALAHRPYAWLADCSDQLAERLGKRFGLKLNPDDVLIDAPPTGLEVQFDVEINDRDRRESLEEISPVVKCLAQKQFDDFVKRVRVFIHPRWIGQVSSPDAERELDQLVNG